MFLSYDIRKAKDCLKYFKEDTKEHKLLTEMIENPDKHDDIDEIRRVLMIYKELEERFTSYGKLILDFLLSEEAASILSKVKIVDDGSFCNNQIRIDPKYPYNELDFFVYVQKEFTPNIIEPFSRIDLIKWISAHFSTVYLNVYRVNDRKELEDRIAERTDELCKILKLTQENDYEEPDDVFINERMI